LFTALETVKVGQNSWVYDDDDDDDDDDDVAASSWMIRKDLEREDEHRTSKKNIFSAE
jgi:hypothetical protein